MLSGHFVSIGTSGKHFISSGWILLILILFFLPNLSAQSPFGRIRGIAQDPAGLAIPGAEIKVHSFEENTDRTVVADGSGAFAVENLKPGPYSLTASKQGFEDASLPQVMLGPQQDLRVTLKLALKQDNTVVEVSAAADQWNTENGIISDFKTTEQITSMPLNFRAATTSPLACVELSPQAQQDSQSNIALGAAMPAQVGFSVDGISTANDRLNGPLEDAYPSSEAIAEVKVTSFNNNAEYAQVGDVTFTSRSGTNQLHGSAFEYLQNDVFDAKVYNFNVKAPKRFNTFGGSLGGPVSFPRVYDGRNRTFFFFDFEGNRRRTVSATGFQHSKRPQITSTLVRFRQHRREREESETVG